MPGGRKMWFLQHGYRWLYKSSRINREKVYLEGPDNNRQFFFSVSSHDKKEEAMKKAEEKIKEMQFQGDGIRFLKKPLLVYEEEIS